MIRFGIIGFGLHAVKRLMPGFRLARNARVTALSRRDPDKAAASAREYGIPLAFTSVEELCHSPEVDAVFVATPNSLHRDDVLRALRFGKPVLVEKPMGVNAEECREMVEAARRAGLLLGVAQIFRFADSTARLRERISARRDRNDCVCTLRVLLLGPGTCSHLDYRFGSSRRRSHCRRRRALH